MINIREVKSTDDPYFAPAMRIYEESFPPSERHRTDVIKNRMDKGRYRMFAGFSDKTPALVALFWRLDGTDFILFDYMAVSKKLRGRGFGSFFMRNIMRTLNVRKKFLILEVEDPKFGDNTEERVERVKFFKRNGAKTLKGVRYILPPLLGPDQTEMILMVMPEYGRGKMPGKLLKGIVRQIYKELYGRGEKDPLLNSFIEDIPEKVKLG